MAAVKKKKGRPSWLRDDTPSPNAQKKIVKPKKRFDGTIKAKTTLTDVQARKNKAKKKK